MKSWQELLRRTARPLPGVPQARDQGEQRSLMLSMSRGTISFLQALAGH